MPKLTYRTSVGTWGTIDLHRIETEFNDDISTYHLRGFNKDEQFVRAVVDVVEFNAE